MVLSPFFLFHTLVPTRRVARLSLHSSLLTCWGQDVWWDLKNRKCMPLPCSMLLAGLPGKRKGFLAGLLVGPWGVMEATDDFGWPVPPAVWSPRSLPQLLLLYFPPLSLVRLPEGNWLRSTKAPDPVFLLVGEEASCGAGCLYLKVLSPNWQAGGDCSQRPSCVLSILVLSVLCYWWWVTQ